MTSLPSLVHLNQIADEYEAILCDVWGVIHNGREVFWEAVDALRRYREVHGPVVLITNAPVPEERVLMSLERVGVPDDCYDAVVTSGDATRAELEKRMPGPVYCIGPDYDDPLYQGLAMEYTTKIEEAAFISCTGLREIPKDQPENYRDELSKLAARELDMLCANPDLVFKYGDELIPSAGALAKIYEELGGRVIRPGKPGAPIYELAYKKLTEILGYKPVSDAILAIGDGPATDARGAVREGLDCLFIGGGIHGAIIEESESFLEDAAQLLANDDADAAYAAPALIW
ncbi:TIGR01459 family HAD-type hydrolase [Hirschia maritima]|uniref:TIGR01459 family HAD-type hydrolase n=1 Tax=Hirschia maritima TaxID=1121961 RepID=UPI000377C0B7|nr:TIGR01459 family HAD-type hydrolase [Hirschia maritima]